MRILLTNNALALRAGTELYIAEVAEELKARGHEPFCFTLRPGTISEHLSSRGIPATDDLTALPGRPDVIHGHHYIETTLAALTYRAVPVVSFCHGPEAWQESGCRAPNVVRWIAVDEACRRRLVEDEKIDATKVTTLFNHFDERKFRRRSPLPSRPRRALLISNRLTREHPASIAAQRACAARGLVLTMVGARFGRRADDLESLIADADLVFAKARSAIEAMAVGCAVIQLAHFGAGTLVTAARYDELRIWNFGYRSMTFPLSVKHLIAQIDCYDQNDAASVSARVRAEATLGKTVDALLTFYAEAISGGPIGEYDPMIAANDFLRFQLALSKIPFDELQKTVGVPMRLPTERIPPGEILGTWKKIAAAHSSANKQRSRSDQLLMSLQRFFNKAMGERER